MKILKCLLATLLFSSPVLAVPVVLSDTLGLTDSGSAFGTTIGNGLASSFIASGTSLISVELPAIVLAGSPTGSNLFISLQADAAPSGITNPSGTDLITLVQQGSPLQTAPTATTFLPSSPFSLVAGMTYWVVFNSNVNFGYAWQPVVDNQGVGPGYTGENRTFVSGTWLSLAGSDFPMRVTADDGAPELSADGARVAATFFSLSLLVLLSRRRALSSI